MLVIVYSIAMKHLQAQLLQNSQQYNERVAMLERQLKDAKDKLVQETELVVKLKKKNSELTKNITQFDTTVREQKDKLTNLLAKCASQERELSCLNTQLDQEKQMSGQSGDRVQELQGSAMFFMKYASVFAYYEYNSVESTYFIFITSARYLELSEEMERLRKGYSDRSQEIKGFEEKLAAKEKHEAILQLELKNANNRYNSMI